MKRVYRTLAHGTLLASLALSSACSILPKPQPQDVYRLPATQSATPQARAVSWSLKVSKPQTGDALNDTKIAVIPQGNLISAYKASRWNNPTPILLRNRLLDGFAQDGRVTLLSTDDSNFQTDLELGGNLQAFQTEYQGNSAEVVIRLDALLVRGTDQRILASKRFEVHQPLSDLQVPGVVVGFGQAGDTLTRQVIAWTVEQGQKVAPARP
ncbi:cholesterol transport system auxiliary component [Pseudomonas sp. ok272]|uniref:ABC-type transport auxiliary lipoprotein family protein n=1 Tax=unclassified Pseudomonas TaxID=196821 RepID=UPI0008B5781A|nr:MULTISPECIES: ABC-type transport auxiliary lipoprotein family protein [unclassified Pseudomonas]SEM64825.1 cholesterol transport system auxiliary component [Pseudomonas sp. ok272]SFM44726.1 cholesterol transport system auxiliary component [Pseudomonas sp. ok602]